MPEIGAGTIVFTPGERACIVFSATFFRSIQLIVTVWCKLGRVNLVVKQALEPTETQYLVINALETLELLLQQTFDPDSGFWYIHTPSPTLPIAIVLPSGDITRVNVPVNATRSARPQAVVLNALQTLELLLQRALDPDAGFCYIRTPSPLLPIAIILPNGGIVPIDWMSEQ